MQEYDIKRGHFKEIEDRVPELMTEHFGECREEGEWMVASFGALKEVRVRIDGKTTAVVDTTMNVDVDNETAVETREAWNDFLEELTGFNAKKRSKRAQEKAKKAKKAEKAEKAEKAKKGEA